MISVIVRLPALAVNFNASAVFPKTCGDPDTAEPIERIDWQVGQADKGALLIATATDLQDIIGELFSLASGMTLLPFEGISQQIVGIEDFLRLRCLQSAAKS